ncbi:hypothetical protein CW304_19680 [Bacillus sp. UFRGS-B20]|nr:hypothetical protein CW304_19680 [Bacillus sp. UFRGS-B20]
MFKRLPQFANIFVVNNQNCFSGSDKESNSRSFVQESYFHIPSSFSNCRNTCSSAIPYHSFAFLKF